MYCMLRLTLSRSVWQKGGERALMHHLKSREWDRDGSTNPISNENVGLEKNNGMATKEVKAHGRRVSPVLLHVGRYADDWEQY